MKRALLLLLALSCVRASVTGNGRTAQLKARASNCPLQIFQHLPASTPVDVLGEVEIESRTNTPSFAFDALKAQACGLGAEALVITKEFTRIGDMAVMRGVALRYRAKPSDPLRPEPTQL